MQCARPLVHPQGQYKDHKGDTCNITLLPKLVIGSILYVIGFAHS